MFLKVTGEGENKYLIATSEQALCAYHQGKRIEKKDLPTRYAGYSTCFRKEAGSHGNYAPQSLPPLDYQGDL